MSGKLDQYLIVQIFPCLLQAVLWLGGHNGTGVSRPISIPGDTSVLLSDTRKIMLLWLWLLHAKCISGLSSQAAPRDALKGTG